MDTTAMPGGEWPWTYEVDLLKAYNIRRVKLTFPQNSYATVFRIVVSLERQKVDADRAGRGPQRSALHAAMRADEGGSSCESTP